MARKRRLRVKRFLGNILAYTFLWMIAFDLFMLFRVYGLDLVGVDPAQIPPTSTMLLLNLLSSFIAGIGSSITDLFLSSRSIRKMPFGKIIGFTLLNHLIMIGVLLVLFFNVIDILNLEVSKMVSNITDPNFIKISLPYITYTTIVALIFITVRQMKYKFGPGNMMRLFMGKYHKPKAEILIFGFVDLNSSTTAAERLGNRLYSELIQDCFLDLTDPAQDHKARIYQYVGDEIVVYWPLKHGLKNNNALHFFHDFVEVLESKREYYETKYNWFPTFKAGLHMGEVIATEVGYIKRDIAYHGDVLNTAARLLERCKPLGEKMLISGELYHLIDHKDDRLEFEPHGEELLRGKDQGVRIFGVSLPGSKQKDTKIRTLNTGSN